ncbi:MAG TPA: hypothetical protein VKG82_09065 [Solirubrobacteraceae bacterium]|nr:hypothetical protein [Solirubrobacteraceae bacterium]
MSTRLRPIAAPLAYALVAAAASLSLTAATARAYSERSVGTPEQIAWVRRAAGNFLAAELARNGSGTCGVLNAPLRATRHGVTCEQRWDAKIAGMLRQPGERSLLRSLHHAASSARVVVHGSYASIDLAASLLGGSQPNRFLWTENCWMLSG